MTIAVKKVALGFRASTKSHLIIRDSYSVSGEEEKNITFTQLATVK